MAVVTTAECQAYLRLSAGTDDTLIGILRDAAESWIESEWGIGLSSAAHEEYLDGGGNALIPGYYPVTAITQVYDEESEEAEDADNYHLRGRWLIRRDGGGRWPEGDDQIGRGRYRVTYTAGFSTLPAILKLVVLQLVARAYENRAGTTWEAAAGHSISFPALGVTDVIKTLQGIKPGGLIG